MEQENMIKEKKIFFKIFMKVKRKQKKKKENE